MTGERTLPNAGLINKWTPGSNGWDTGLDADLALIDALLFLSVRSATLTSPPTSPVAGDRYIVAASATGAWAGNVNKVAVYIDSAWVFYAPKKGWKSDVEDTTSRLAFDGAGWNVEVSSAGSAATGSTPHRFWRINVNSTTYGGFGSIAELAFASTAGGTSLFSGGTPSASSVNDPGYEANRAVDGNSTTWWNANSNATSWWQYDFGANPVVVAEIRMQARNDSQAGANCAPATWDILYSDDGTNFVLVKSFTSAAWTPGSTQTFSTGQTVGSTTSGTTASARTYPFPQSSASATWLIAHNLNRYPSVTTVDSAGTIIEGVPRYVDSNNIEVDFGSPISGITYLN